MLNLPQWTSKAPPAPTVPLTLEWWKPHLRPQDFSAELPPHVTETGIEKGNEKQKGEKEEAAAASVDDDDGDTSGENSEE